MTSNNVPWADTPFTLIPTPGGSEDLAKLDDEVWIAREMANAHNGMLRALNSIYQQCIHVKEPKDIKDLLLYADFWCGWIHEHHEGEEKFFFPQAEEITGVKGLMDVNVGQHHAFMGGLEKFQRFAKETKVQRYDGSEMRRIIEGFGGELTKHLTEEIDTLLGLKKYDTVALRKAFVVFDLEMRKGEKVSQLFLFEENVLIFGRVYCFQLFLDRRIGAMKIGLNSLGQFSFSYITGSRGSIKGCGDFVLQPPGVNDDLSCSHRKSFEKSLQEFLVLLMFVIIVLFLNPVWRSHSS
jgi:hemerythrin-like domain-containing protein